MLRSISNNLRNSNRLLRRHTRSTNNAILTPFNNDNSNQQGRRNYCDLSGKVIVVAGAGNPPEEGHGIGATTSLILARRGAKVVSVSNVDVNANTITDCILQEGNEVSWI